MPKMANMIHEQIKAHYMYVLMPRWARLVYCMAEHVVLCTLCTCVHVYMLLHCVHVAMLPTTIFGLLLVVPMHAAAEIHQLFYFQGFTVQLLVTSSISTRRCMQPLLK